MVELKDYEILKRLFSLESKIDSLFRKESILTLSKIKEYLTSKNFNYYEDEIRYIINLLLVNRGSIVRNDFWDKESNYEMLNQHLELSSYSKHYYSFEVDNYKTKKFLLITDTEIGNDNIEDFKILHNIYDYAIKDGVKKCFHLGDLFAGNINKTEFNLDEKMIQIKRFIDSYPKPLTNEMMTYGLLGNHDKMIDDDLCHHGYSDYYYDLKKLNLYNPSFHIIPRGSWCTKFLDKKFIFSHKFYHNSLMRDLKIFSKEDIIEHDKWLDSSYDVHISGHLHKGIIYMAEPNRFNDNQQIFLGVPSTSKLNINGIVGYLVTLNYKDEKEITDMNVTMLFCDNNYRIYEYNTFNWKFNNDNKFIKKIRVM